MLFVATSLIFSGGGGNRIYFCQRCERKGSSANFDFSALKQKRLSVERFPHRPYCTCWRTFHSITPNESIANIFHRVDEIRSNFFSTFETFTDVPRLKVRLEHNSFFRVLSPQSCYVNVFLNVRLTLRHAIRNWSRLLPVAQSSTGCTYQRS